MSALAGYLRPIAPVHLDTILELLLNYLVSLSLSHDAASVEDLVSALVEAHDVPREVSSQVMGWFGQVDEGTWKMDVKAVVAEIGLGILRHHKVLFVSPPASPRAEHGTMGKARTHSRDRIHDEMEKRRRGRVRVGCVAPTALRTSIPPLFSGDSGTHERAQGNYLRNPSDVSGTTLSYLATSALPTDPAARFAELFLTRPRWKSDEIEPFLSDMAVSAKERDKLLLKHARAITTPEGTWYTARVGYHN